MSEESAQQPTGELEAAPAANHRASSQDNTLKHPPRKPPRRLRLRGEHIIRFLASLLCLAAAGYYMYQGDLFKSIILLGLATGAINPREVVGMLHRRSNQRDDVDE